jgi:hypothetical protein
MNTLSVKENEPIEKKEWENKQNDLDKFIN